MPSGAAPSPSALAAHPRSPAAAWRDFEQADFVVVARLGSPKIEAVLESEPGIYVHAFDVATVKRIGGGALPSRVSTNWSTTDRTEPWPSDALVIVALRRLDASLMGASTKFVALAVEAHTPELEKAIAAMRRPAPSDLAWSAVQVPAQTVRKWENEYGDGEFDLTLENKGAQPREVPGLFASGGKVLWEQAIVVRDERGRVLPLSRAPLVAGAVPVVLQPGASIKTRVDVKRFGIEEPYGAAHYTYSFGIGELRVSSYFYYTHRLHGPQMGPLQK